VDDNLNPQLAVPIPFTPTPSRVERIIAREEARREVGQLLDRYADMRKSHRGRYGNNGITRWIFCSCGWDSAGRADKSDETLWALHEAHVAETSSSLRGALDAALDTLAGG
jgi:hypothetical protein